MIGPRNQEYLEKFVRNIPKPPKNAKTFQTSVNEEMDYPHFGRTKMSHQFDAR